MYVVTLYLNCETVRMTTLHSTGTKRLQKRHTFPSLPWWHTVHLVRLLMFETNTVLGIMLIFFNQILLLSSGQYQHIVDMF